MDGYYLAAAALSRHADLLQTAQERRRAWDAAPDRRALRAARRAARAARRSARQLAAAEARAEAAPVRSSSRAGSSGAAPGDALAEGEAASVATHRSPVDAVRGFLWRGWLTPPTELVAGHVPGDGRGAEASNLAYGPAGAATACSLRAPAGHGMT